MIKALGILSVVFIGAKAFATVTVTATGASTAVKANGGTAVVYYYSNISDTVSGLYWNDGGGSTCSKKRNRNCKLATDTLTVKATSTAEATSASRMILVAESASTTTSTIKSQRLDTQSFTKGQELTFTPITFARICSDAYTNGVTNISSSCTNTPGSTSQIIISVYVDIDGSGTYETTNKDELGSITLDIVNSIPVYSNVDEGSVYSFTIFPGDEKVRFDDIKFGTKFPINSNGIGIQYVRFYGYSSTTSTLDLNGFNSIVVSDSTDASPFFQETPDASTGKLSNTSFKGIPNDVYSYFKVALVDNAGNLGYESPTSDNTSTHASVPSQVVGLLASQYKCFIATAAFGAEYEDNIKILRDFRDKILTRTPSGQKFISFYTKVSPPIANFIEKSDSLRALTRLFLYPFVGFSYLSLRFGAYNASLLFAIFLMFPLLIARRITTPQPDFSRPKRRVRKI